MPFSARASEPPRRVLVIEDSAPDRVWLRARLAREDLQAVEAADGPSGLASCLADPPDLVLLDLRLPSCDGFEVLRLLKAEARTRAVPVIVISGLNSAADKARALDMGAVDFVTKPYDPVELGARVRAALRTKLDHDRLMREASRDALTGLANRRALEERLEHEWSLRRRHPAPLAVWMVDLDHFKQINDAYGHLSGDAVIVRAAVALRRSVRATDLVARYGGEEFAVVAPHCPLAGAMARAESFRSALEREPIAAGRHLISVSVSIGVAAVPDDAVESGLDLLAAADRALYRAKQAGRNRVETSRPVLAAPTAGANGPGPSAGAEAPALLPALYAAPRRLTPLR